MNISCSSRTWSLPRPHAKSVGEEALPERSVPALESLALSRRPYWPPRPPWVSRIFSKRPRKPTSQPSTPARTTRTSTPKRTLKRTGHHLLVRPCVSHDSTLRHLRQLGFVDRCSDRCHVIMNRRNALLDGCLRDPLEGFQRVPRPCPRVRRRSWYDRRHGIKTEKVKDGNKKIEASEPGVPRSTLGSSMSIPTSGCPNRVQQDISDQPAELTPTTCSALAVVF